MDGKALPNSRGDMLAEDNPRRELPPVTIAPHLVQYVHELGLQKNTGMGAAPVDWVDIKAWAQLTCTELHADEARILRLLSFHYVSQYNISKPHDAPAPTYD